MAKKRYVKDYDLETDVDSKGRIRLTPRYNGEQYFFAHPADVIARQKRIRLLALAAGWAGYLAALVLPSSAMHVLFVALTFVITGVPLFLLFDYTVSFARMQAPLERRHADIVNNKIPPAALFTALFPVVALAGEIWVLASGSPLQTGDILFMAGAGVLTASGTLAFAQHKKIAARI